MHAYAVPAVFTMTEADGTTTHDMIMVRNPWGLANYNQDWHAGDARWTDELADQVPLGIDPRVDQAAKGVFVVPKELLATCFENIETAHLREGYSDDWYDALDMDGEWHTYYFSPTA